MHPDLLGESEGAVANTHALHIGNEPRELAMCDSARLRAAPWMRHMVTADNRSCSAPARLPYQAGGRSSLTGHTLQTVVTARVGGTAQVPQAVTCRYCRAFLDAGDIGICHLTASDSAANDAIAHANREPYLG